LIRFIRVFKNHHSPCAMSLRKAQHHRRASQDDSCLDSPYTSPRSQSQSQEEGNHNQGQGNRSGSGGGGGKGRSTLDTPSIHALASTPYNSPIFHPELYPSNSPAGSGIEFSALFPPAQMNGGAGVGVGGGLPMGSPFTTRAFGSMPPQTPYINNVGVSMTPMHHHNNHHPNGYLQFQPTLSNLNAPMSAAQLGQLQQLQQLQSLQAQLLAQQHAHAQAQQHQGVQAIYATPAAWHKQRQFLLNQPTPTALDVAPSPMNSHALPSSLASNRKGRRPSSSPHARAASSMEFPTHSATANNHGGSEDLPPALSPPPHLRSFSSFSLTSPTGSTSNLGLGDDAAEGGDSSGKRSSRGGPAATRPVSTAAAAAAVSSSKLAHIQASLRHLKKLQLLHEEEKATAIQKTRIQKTFLSLSSFLIVLFVGILAYYDYLILSPHLTALFWSILFWILLDQPQRWLLRFFSWLDSRFLDKNARRIELIGCILTIVFGFYLRTQLSSLIILSLLFLTLTFFLFGDRHTVTAVLLLVIILLLLAFPLFLFTKTCVLESQEIALRLRSFIESNTEFQHLLSDFSTSHTFLAMQNYVRRWGYEIPTTSVEQLREWILKSIVQFADQITTILTSVYGLLSNVGNLLVSLVTFASMLYFLLVSNKEFGGTLTWLSPFSADDNSKLVSTLKKSVMSIFVCSLSVGLIHVIVTYISFSLCGIDLCLILSFISGFAAMLPIFSSWIIWLPACGGLLLAGQTIQAVILCAIQMTLLFYVDPLIYSNIPGNSYVIGLSIVFAAYTFGAAGVLLGPLLAGMSFTFLSIYRDYISLPLYTQPNGQSTGTGGLSQADYGTLSGLDSSNGGNATAASLAAAANAFASAGTGTMEPLHYGGFRRAIERQTSVGEVGSISTAHSSNTLAQLANGLQSLADRSPSASSGTSSLASTPLSRAKSVSGSSTSHVSTGNGGVSPKATPAGATARTLRFASPLGNASSAQSTPSSISSAVSSPSPNPTSPLPATTHPIVEGNEADHSEGEDSLILSPAPQPSTLPHDEPDDGHDGEHEPDHEVDETALELQATHEELLQQYQLEVEQAHRLQELEAQHVASELHSLQQSVENEQLLHQLHELHAEQQEQEHHDEEGSSEDDHEASKQHTNTIRQRQTK
jgi:predicted PurR-regulated permease PerM